MWTYISVASKSSQSLILLSAVFFSWGLLTSANSILVPYFQSTFSLSYEQSMLVQLAFYFAPFAISIPTSALMARKGYKLSLTVALILTFLGSLCLCISFYGESFVFALSAVFITAMGVAALQVVANPYIIRTSNAQNETKRLTIASTFNSLGTTIGPIVLGIAMISIGLSNIYLVLSALLVLLACTLYSSSITDYRSVESVKILSHLATLRHQPQFIFGAATIFVYVGVEVSIGTVTISYLSDPNIGGFSAPVAATLMSLYWAGSLLGRFGYSIFAQRISAMNTLFSGACIAMILLSVAILSPSLFGGVALIMIGLCNSFMYPIIFSRAVSGLGDASGAASAILIMCGIGGGIIPMIQAMLITRFDVPTSYLIPVLCYAFIASFAFIAKKRGLSIVTA
ncbi:MFS transporter [Vibrio mediterranei]|nr:MFS transporter [Vibrio mediterranei]